jgi:hypothetical protein
MAAAAGLRTVASAGMTFDPLRRQWRESRDLSINYIMAFEKHTLPAAAHNFSGDQSSARTASAA